MIRKIAFLFLSTVGSLPISAQELIDKQTRLVKDSGWELVRAHCGGCHSHKIVTNQHSRSASLVRHDSMDAGDAKPLAV